MTLRVAIVGCGKAAENHVAEIKKLSNVSLLAACDSEPLMAEQFCLRQGVGASYTDFEQLLAEQRPDVVHIATPPQSHADLALTAIENGCHVMVEKPLAESSAVASEVIRYAERNGCKLTVGWTYYFDPVVRSMRERVARGTIGDPVHLDAFLAYDLHGRFGAAVLDDAAHWVHGLRGKLVQNNLDHLLSLVVDFVDHDSVVSNLSAWRATHSPYPDLVDELRLTLAGERICAQIAFSCRARPLGHFFTIVGSKNTLRLNLANQTLTEDSSSRLPGPLGRLACGLDQTRQLASQSFSNLARVIRSDFQALPGLGYLLSAFYRSVERDEDVPIPYAHILRVSTWIDHVVNGIRDAQAVYQ
jgi:predicted dehydrogenase